jgi:hypothetical protein
MSQMNAFKGNSIPTIYLQPRPIRTRVARIQQQGRWSTSIARLFSTQDLGRCRLCPCCSADPETGLCLIVARRYVSDHEAPLYVFRGEGATGEQESSGRGFPTG